MLKDAVWIVCAIATLAIQFWALKKPIETKVAILRLPAVVAGGIAVADAAYFQISVTMKMNKIGRFP
jgi:hypothetical protein